MVGEDVGGHDLWLISLSFLVSLSLQIRGQVSGCKGQAGGS
jgi:hypothetical protein